MDELLNTRIDNARTALKNATNDWQRNYWTIVLGQLLRKFDESNRTS